jgi:hypothetical protein
MGLFFQLLIEPTWQQALIPSFRIFILSLTWMLAATGWEARMQALLCRNG